MNRINPSFFESSGIEAYFWPGTGDVYEQGYMGTGLGQTNSGAITFVYRDSFAELELPAPSDLVSVSDKISDIRSTLSLNITQTAAVLMVRRPTIYSWLREHSVLRSRNTHRLDLIYYIAEMWRKLSDAPIENGLYLSLNKLGDNLIQLLSEDNINVGDIKQALISIASKADELPRSSLSPNELLDSMGVDLQYIKNQRDVIDDLSGKRHSDSED